MNPADPPPLPPPQPPRRPSRPLRQQPILFLSVLLGPTVIAILLCLRLLGLLRPLSVPTGSMTPTVSPGDHVIMEGLTYLARPPRRGDVVIFRTDGIGSLPAGQLYAKRVIGQPGEHLLLANGQLFINDQPVHLTNNFGEVSFAPIPELYAQDTQTNLTIPPDTWFVTGDNSINSYDSRSYGSIPRKNIIGRLIFCYYPPARIGAIK